MRITKGERLEKYADVIGADIDEVVDWANAYVNHPEGNFPLYEETERERFESLKAFVMMRIKVAECYITEGMD